MALFISILKLNLDNILFLSWGMFCKTSVIFPWLCFYSPKMKSFMEVFPLWYHNALCFSFLRTFSFIHMCVYKQTFFSAKFWRFFKIFLLTCFSRFPQDIRSDGNLIRHANLSHHCRFGSLWLGFFGGWGLLGSRKILYTQEFISIEP